MLQPIKGFLACLGPLKIGSFLLTLERSGDDKKVFYEWAVRATESHKGKDFRHIPAGRPVQII